jgi:D-glycero-alpha-D-manno-heptose-7-phosphate kinase
MIIVQTPLRVSLFGGGTDFPDYYQSEGGCVLSTAIDKYIFVIIKKRYDDRLRIGYTRTEIVDSVDEIQHELIRESLRTTGIAKGVEILTMGDIPAGSGLGSSSAVTVGALHAMYVYLSQLVTTDRLAREACEIEITKLGKPIGIQDQYIAAYGGLRFIEFNQDGSVTADPVHLDPLVKRRLDENLLVFFTGVTRKADSILAEQKENINQRLALLREMKEMAHEARRQLCADNVDALGYLLHQSWLLKKQLASRISNDTIEEAYQAALAAGALGGKITGAGGGGFLLLYCPYERREAVRTALKSMQELPFHLEPDGTKVILNMRR